MGFLGAGNAKELPPAERLGGAGLAKPRSPGRSSRRNVFTFLWLMVLVLLFMPYGLYTWGADLPQAVRHVEILEFLMEVMGRSFQPSALSSQPG